MRVSIKVLLVLVTLSMPSVQSKKKNFSRLKSDPLSKTRCDLVCLDVVKEKKVECRSQCWSQELKPGACPAADNPKWAEACVEACNTDSQCDETQKCCRYGCSTACLQPVDLLSLSGLPALPIMSDPVEKRKSIILRWSDGVGDLARAVPGRVLYLLEEQHHLGPKYEQDRLGDWNLIMRTNKTKVSLRNLLKPGRWYRFRVAAVSVAGTRGYSMPTAPITPRRGPRPPPQPKRLRVHPLKSENGNITVRLEWKEPRSDLPIVRYKVFWSRRVRGLDGELDSVLVNHENVLKGQNYFDVTDLQPNSMYFLQVQTISQFGLGKLRSDKASVFFNTTNSNAIPAEQSRRKTKKIKGLELQKVIWQNQIIKARVAWTPLPKVDGRPKRYFVHWETIRCENKQNKKKEFAATTEQSSFDIYELDYQCSYKVNVNRSRSKNITDSEIIVKIPDCEHFQRALNGTTQITC